MKLWEGKLLELSVVNCDGFAGETMSKSISEDEYV